MNTPCKRGKFDFLKEARVIMLEPQLAAFVNKVAQVYGENPIEVVHSYDASLDIAFSEDIFDAMYESDLNDDEIEEMMDRIHLIRTTFNDKRPSVIEYVRFMAGGGFSKRQEKK